MSIRSRLDKLEVQAGAKPTPEGLKAADSAIRLGMIQPEEREQFARDWKGFEHALQGLEATCEADR